MTPSEITWEDGFRIIDGRSFKFGVIRGNGKAPAQVRCDIDMAVELEEDGKPIDDAITLVRME